MLDENEYHWPACFPENVPDPEKDDIIEASGTVYRLVRNIPPTRDDFRMHQDDSPGYPYRSKDKNKAYGVSLWKKLSQIRQKKQNYPDPRQFGNMSIVHGDLVPELGMMTKKPVKGHVTLWLYDGAQPENYINSMDDEE